jgi:hypothetical protein
MYPYHNLIQARRDDPLPAAAPNTLAVPANSAHHRSADRAHRDPGGPK